MAGGAAFRSPSGHRCPRAEERPRWHAAACPKSPISPAPFCPPRLLLRHRCDPAPLHPPTLQRLHHLQRIIRPAARWIGQASHPSNFRSSHLSSHLSINLPFPLSTHPSIHLPIYLSIHPSRPGAFFRYGRGLYFSKVSSKSNDYAAASERRDPHSLQRGAYRLMFLCKVAAGEATRAKCPTSQPPTATHRSPEAQACSRLPSDLDAKERSLPKVSNAAASYPPQERPTARARTSSLRTRWGGSSRRAGAAVPRTPSLASAKRTAVRLDGHLSST